MQLSSGLHVFRIGMRRSCSFCSARPKKTLLAGILCLSGFVHHSQAELILTIDTGAEEFFFTGSSSSITPELFGGSNTVAWSPNNTLNSFSVDIGGINSGLSAPGNTLANGFVLVSNTDFEIRTIYLSSNALTLSGNGNRFSYNGITASEKSFFESTIGSSVPLNRGTGGEAITVLAFIPEPTTAFCVVGLVTTAFLRRRRRFLN